MTNKLIILNTGDVEAVIDGVKTQHRIPMKFQPPDSRYELNKVTETTGPSKRIGTYFWSRFPSEDSGESLQMIYFRPPYEIGDIVGIKEIYCLGCPGDDDSCCYKATLRTSITDFCDEYENRDIPWRSPATMPQNLIRLWVTITGLRRERLQEIGEIDQADILKEGYPWGIEVNENEVSLEYRRFVYSQYWDRYRGRKYPFHYHLNPEVWVYDFTRIYK